jgi:dihydroorotate dehydrogenase electron transfer subunit
MPTLETKLLEIRQLGQERMGLFDLPDKFLPHPGQYLPCQKSENNHSILPAYLFQSFGAHTQMTLGPLPENWYPGDQIRFLPPQGKGFTLPPSARRVGLLPLGVSPLRLLALIKLALAQNAAIALFCDPKPSPNLLNQLPAMIEVGSVASLQENLAWPDFLALESGRENLENLQSLLGKETPGFEGQVLVKTPMPCRGIGDCGACAVKTRHGRRQACTDGPVFLLEDLLYVAG